MSKKNMLLAIFLIVLFSSTYSFASEPYPSKDIEIIVPFAAGGGLDLMSRTLAVQLSDILGTQVIVVNKPGAGGSVGTTLALKSKPDGYTLVTVSPSSILFSPNFKKVEYDPLKDISYIAGWVNQPLGIQVLAESQFKNLNDLLTFAKNNPGKIKYGASFNGYGHIYMEAIAKERGIKWSIIPSAGDGEMLPSLLGGHTDVSTMAVRWVSYARTGQIRPLALFCEKRLSSFPETPVLNEFGFDFPMPAASLIGIGAPKGVPADIVGKLERAFQVALDSADFKKVAETQSLEIWFRNSSEFKKTAEEGFQGIGEMAKRLGLKE